MAATPTNNIYLPLSIATINVVSIGVRLSSLEIFFLVVTYCQVFVGIWILIYTNIYMCNVDICILIHCNGPFFDDKVVLLELFEVIFHVEGGHTSLKVVQASLSPFSFLLLLFFPLLFNVFILH